MVIEGKKIAIVGGGPGGLTLARLLQQKGADVHVYERDVHRAAREQGTTLDLHEESGLAALRAAGLMDAFKANYRPGADRLRILDKDAVIHFDDHANGQLEESRPEIDRGPLRTILLESLQPGTVVWDSYFESMKRNLHSGDDNGWTIQFKNGTSASADLVIAADGANSKIRPLITPIRPFYAGITVVEGIVYNAQSASPKIAALLKGDKLFVFGGSKSLIVSAKGDGSYVFYTGCRTDENWVTTSGINFNDKAQVTTWFKTEFADWGPIWAELFSHAEPHFTPRPQYCMPLDQSWDALPDLTMLGDAAHLMPPYAGEGVNMAMLDALELSECLTSDSFSDLQTAIATYETQMRVRASETARMTLESTEMLHSADAIANMMNLFNPFEEHGQ